MENRFNVVYGVLIIVFGVLAIMPFVLLGGVLYITFHKITVVDSTQSADGAYEVILQSVGEPVLFGSAPGRLVLKKEGNVVSDIDIEIANDGGSISERSWSVTWYDDHVGIMLFGQEQYDELVTLYYDGQAESCRLTTHYGVEKKNVSDDAVGEEADTEFGSEAWPSPEEQQITAGYKAIYELYSDRPIDDFGVYYGAKVSSSRCILSEDENTVEYIVYNGKSEDEKCGLYVYFQSKKNTDGKWNANDGIIMDIYIYEYESGNVVSSGKTNW